MCRHPLIIVALLAGLLAACPCLSQQREFKIYSINDGMVANSVRFVFQDSKGFLWIGTWEGLSKYDGHRFTNYTLANGLSDNMVNDMYEDEDGKLYVACNNGKVDIIAENGSIRKAVIGNVVVNRFFSTSYRRVLAATDDKGIQELRNERLLRPAQAFPDHIYYDFAELNDSLLVGGSDRSLYILNKRYEFYSKLEAGPLFVNRLYRDLQNRVWVGSQTGLKLLSSSQRQQTVAFAPLPAAMDIPVLRNASIRDIYEDQRGNLWFATSEGLVKIEPGGRQFHYTENNGLPSSDVQRVYQDREMNLWVGTAIGLARLITVNTVRVSSEEDGWTNGKPMYIIPLQQGNMLVNTVSDLRYYNAATKRFTPVKNANNYYNAFGVDGNTPVLVEQYSKLVRYDAATNTLTAIGHTKGLPAYIDMVATDMAGNVFALYKDTLFIASHNNVQRESVRLEKVWCLLTDRRNQLWLGTRDSGLICFQYQNTASGVVLSNKREYLENRHIRSLYQDSRGNIWAGTRHNGAYRLSAGNNGGYDILHFDQQSGLTSNWIRAITEDTRQNIWLGFYQGLDKLVPHDKVYRVFNFSRIINYFTSINSLAAGPDHSLWLTTINGLVNITDGRLEEQPPLPVYIMKISLKDTSYTFTRDGHDKVSLTHHQNQLQFEFTSPGYINEQQLMYSYRLLGSNDTGWSKPSNQHVVSYASLQPGDYVFEVRSLGWNGAWGIPARSEFSIRAPFWQKSWFRLGIVLLIGGLAAVLVRRRIKRIRHEAGLRNKISETEMMALRAQMNPHFIFNCLNSIDNLIQNNEKEKATGYLAKFAKLIRAILENSKQEAIPVWKDIEALKLYLELESLRCDHRFSYHISVNQELVHGDYKVPPLIIQPFVENAIHHGLLNKQDTNRVLLIDAGIRNGDIRFVVEDNGIGRREAAAFKKINKPAHESLGLNITRERIDLHNGRKVYESVVITDLADATGRPTGTRAEIILENK